ncbi:MAG TPA: hypothetical protein VME45_11695 [Stellaceae bacterium]|nr:hypothetical protein [Stellaceae bacterium]
MATTNLSQHKAAAPRARPRRLPPVADYSDVVTDEQIERIKTLVPESEYANAKVVAGPAW